jgi:hypothetical protein
LVMAAAIAIAIFAATSGAIVLAFWHYRKA